MTEDSVPKIIGDMLVLARYKDNEVNEKDLENFIENTSALITHYHNNEYMHKIPESLG